MHQLLWQALDRSTAGPSGFHISWLSPVFWPADRKQPDSRTLYSRALFVVCVVCMKPRVLSWSQVQSRQRRRRLAVEILCFKMTSTEKLFCADILTVSFKSYWNACHVICPLVPLSTSGATSNKNYIVDRICLDCLFWGARNRKWGDNSQYFFGPFELMWDMRHFIWNRAIHYFLSETVGRKSNQDISVLHKFKRQWGGCQSI